MKKTMLFLTIGIIAGAASYAVFAGEQTGGMGGMGMGSMMQKQNMPGKSMMMDKPEPPMCPMHKMMCQSMMQRQIVPTEDGGVVILAGNELMKYDKNLQLIKQVQIKVDMQQMQQKMQKMMEQCPVGKQMQKTKGHTPDSQSSQ